MNGKIAFEAFARRRRVTKLRVLQGDEPRRLGDRCLHRQRDGGERLEVGACLTNYTPTAEKLDARLLPNALRAAKRDRADLARAAHVRAAARAAVE